METIDSLTCKESAKKKNLSFVKFHQKMCILKSERDVENICDFVLHDIIDSF